MRFLTFAAVAIAFICLCATAASAEPSGARLWTEAGLESLSRKLEHSGAPYTPLIKGKTYGALLLHRTVSGDPELHVKLNDFFVILGGTGAIRVGGRVTGNKLVAPDEERGQKLTGGTLYRVRKGDVLFVPANHWLQVFVSKGAVLRAVIIKTQ